jgi:hypothetical protein
MTDIQRKSTAGSALVLIAIAAIVAAVCGGIILYLYSNPDILEGIFDIVVMMALVIVAIGVIAYVAYLILGVAYYATKGEITQTDISYSIDDVESVKESSSEDAENK